MKGYKIIDIAKALDLSERRVQQLVKEGILSFQSRGKYDLIACIKAYEKYLQERKEDKFDNDEIKEQKLRLLKAQAEKAELELEVLKGKYIEASEIEFEWTDLIIKFRSRMLTMPAKLVRALAAAGGDYAKLEQILEDEIYDALTELSKHEDEQPDHQNNQEQAYSA